MAHVHDPVVYHPDKAEILGVVKTSPFAVASALGWLLGTAWHLLVLTATGLGMVVGTAFLAVKFLAFAVAYGFLKGAHIQLVPKKNGPSMPM
jgi:hypothetical protein